MPWSLPLAPGRLRGDHLRMSEQGFMGAPAPIKSTEELVAAPTPDVDGPDWYYEIPKSAMDSVTFKGCEADLYYSVKEPTTAQFMKIVSSGTPPREAVSDYVREIGMPGPDGNVLRDVNSGKPLLQRVDHIRAAQWFARLGTKGQMLVAGMWGELFTPSNDEGESMRGSRRRAG